MYANFFKKGLTFSKGILYGCLFIVEFDIKFALIFTNDLPCFIFKRNISYWKSRLKKSPTSFISIIVFSCKLDLKFLQISNKFF